jgi:hypothetical protein
MTDGTNPVIEPCPFCGEQLENHLGSEFRAQWFHPLDGDCVLMGQGIENVAAWNTRAIPSANPVIVESASTLTAQQIKECRWYARWGHL